MQTETNPTAIMNRITDEVYKLFNAAEARRMCFFVCRYFDIKVLAISAHFKTSQTAIASSEEIVSAKISNNMEYRSRYEQLISVLN